MGPDYRGPASPSLNPSSEMTRLGRELHETREALSACERERDEARADAVAARSSEAKAHARRGDAFRDLTALRVAARAVVDADAWERDKPIRAIAALLPKEEP